MSDKLVANSMVNLLKFLESLENSCNPYCVERGSTNGKMARIQMLLEELTQIPSLKMVSHSKIRATLDIIFKDIPTHCIQNTEENLDFYNYLKVSKPKKERNKAADLQNEADKDQFNRVVTPIMHSIISNMHIYIMNHRTHLQRKKTENKLLMKTKLPSFQATLLA